VAHDFNNLLTPIVGFSTACLDRLPEGHPLREDLVEIHKAGVSAANLTRQLLAVGRQQVLQPEVLDLNAVVTDTVKLLERVLGAHVAIESRLAPSIAAVKVDRDQMVQILTNLAANARDAMPQGGTLTIETADVVLDAAYARTHTGITPGPHVRLTVADSGQGMTADVLGHVFDPFFTTKEFGDGTGLGLATVHGIVRQCGGSVDADSTPGHGAIFRFYFPAVPAVARPDHVRPTPESAVAPRGSETVLLVDDNDAVRRFATRVLLRRGYAVLGAGTGDEALHLVAKHAGALDLLVTDVVMPGMSGRALADRLAGTHPHLKIVYMSGYTADAIGSGGVLDPDMAFLPKPFSADSLAATVRQALDD